MAQHPKLKVVATGTVTNPSDEKAPTHEQTVVGVADIKHPLPHTTQTTAKHESKN